MVNFSLKTYNTADSQDNLVFGILEIPKSNLIAIIEHVCIEFAQQIMTKARFILGFPQGGPIFSRANVFDINKIRLAFSVDFGF